MSHLTTFKKASSGNEKAALSIFHYLSKKYGWTGTVFTRADAETQLEYEDKYDVVTGLKMTDEEWKRISKSNEWLDIQDGMIENAWDQVNETIIDVKRRIKQERENNDKNS